ncbi:aminopeptidase P family protein [Candidatus Roizmanbacteria bacterium]|nr:MAG: aminopeptidase P family protein [Candidatus Roizmanbacteria bacterium]
MDYQKRRQQIQSLLETHNIDAYLVTDFYNILYLTGFKTLSPHEKEAKLVVTQDTVYFITDTRYQTEAMQHFRNNEDIKVMIQGPHRTFLQIFADIIAERTIYKLGFEKYDLSYAWFEYLQKALPKLKVVPCTNIIMQLRNQKDEHELERMRRAAEYTDECLKSIVPYLKQGVHETEIIHKMEDWLREKSLEFSFEPIVAFDDHTALPHYNNKMSDGVLSENSIVLIDIGIRYKDYCSDITRMFFVREPSEDQKKAYDELLSIQKKTIDSIYLNIKMEDIDAVARQWLLNKGYPTIPHSTGHGVGLEVHEGIRAARTVTETLQNNMVLTIEPGIYYESKWGMRIEDTVAFIDGQAETLTKFPKELTVL